MVWNFKEKPTSFQVKQVQLTGCIYAVKSATPGAAAHTEPRVPGWPCPGWALAALTAVAAG